MCRERMISFPWPSLAHGTSHGQAEVQETPLQEAPAQETDLQETDIGDVVRANLLRLSQARGLSLQGLAAVAGVSPAELEDLAAGRSFPALGLLFKLARALDLPCTAFIEAPGTVGLGAPEDTPKVA
jgi:ribosome-binding protein aMBF1 (putative translation factor)